MNASLKVIREGFSKYGDVDNWPNEYRKLIHKDFVGRKSYSNYIDPLTEEYQLVKKLTEHGCIAAGVQRQLSQKGFNEHHKYWITKQMRLLKQQQNFTYQISVDESRELQYYLRRFLSKKRIAHLMGKDLKWVEYVTQKFYPDFFDQYIIQLNLL